MPIPIRRAIISVFDKTGVEELAKALDDVGCQIVSTGSTASIIRAAGVPVTDASDVTSFPECLDGRVKTLHPAIHAGILADRRREGHRRELAELEIEGVDLVVVNLYPFSQTVASGADDDECIEKIDIGGPSMVRGAAKNHANVAVVTDPADYALVSEAVRKGGFDARERAALAAKAFAHTAQYDADVARWMANSVDGEAAGLADAANSRVVEAENAGLRRPGEEAETAETRAGEEAETAEKANRRSRADAGRELFGCFKVADLRYGENPHQAAALYSGGEGGVAGAVQLGGKEMSYNNYQDVDAAVRAAYDHAEPAVAVVKHANPCGVAVAESIARAHSAAHACDPLSAYGGVIAANRQVDAPMAEQIAPIFTEAVAAPSFSADALEILKKKKNLRILKVDPIEIDREIRPISGGVLVQERDRIDAEGDAPGAWRLVSGEPADEATMLDLAFAWRAVRAVKSNAILLAHARATVGIGMGQVNRVDSCRLAVERAGERASGSVAASDAFFPFADGLQILLDAGVRAVVQPGGSVRDTEVIDAARQAGVTMYLTGARHFSH
jgi:bifunctional purine biosynthesis protein purH